MTPKEQKPFTLSGALLFLLSLAYLGCELVFNRQLLDLSSISSADPDQTEHLQHFGRMVSGFGFTLLVLGLFQRYGFRINGKRQWLFFYLVALACALPFIATFGQLFYATIFNLQPENSASYTPEMVWGLFPFIGLYCIRASRGQKRFLTVLGLITLAWPAMFYGQKLAVERFVIAPSTAAERANARYILLIRTGIEDCVIIPENTRLCDDSGGRAEIEKRSARTILGVLFMLNPQAVFQSLSFERENILASVAGRDLWFSSSEYYRRYLQQVADKRLAYERFLTDTYYAPYKKASDLYLATSSPAAQQKISGQASDKIENDLNAGWQQYQRAVSGYRSFALDLAFDAARAADRAQGALKNFNTLDEEKLIRQGRKIAIQKFYDETGYPPDIRTKQDFLKNRKTHQLLRQGVEQQIRKTTGDSGFSLPAQWTYDSASFKKDMQEVLRKKAEESWQANVQKKLKTAIPPGLGKEEFMTYLGASPLPPLKDLAMPEDAFRQKYILPLNRSIAGNALKEMQDDSPLYADGMEKSAVGKDYIRALYIPAIALCLSLLIIVSTVGTYMVDAAVWIIMKTRTFRRLAPHQKNLVRPACWTAFIIMALLLPYTQSNPYASGAAYQKYRRLAKEQAMVTPVFLDWITRMQPLVYKAGNAAPLRRVFRTFSPASP